jgi:UrcA family protein
MAERTCAACDCKLDSDPIKVSIGGKAVEVCCEDCAQKLRESQVSVAAAVPRKGTLAAFVLTALGALLFAHASVVRAAPLPDVPPRQAVYYGDLDLTQTAGIESLYGRLNRAARKVCSSYVLSVGKQAELRHAACIRKAVSEAVSDIGNPRLTERHLAQRHGKTWRLQAGR